MHKNLNISASDALIRLKKGNDAYLNARFSGGEISPELRKKTADGGQHPYAIIVSCSDSRVIPESIFTAGIGDLFVVRVAGNVIDNHQLGSIEYAASHLGCPLALVLGHTRCGAVNAAVRHGSESNEGYVRFILDEILLAARGETDENTVCRMNVERSVSVIRENLCEKESPLSLKVQGAIYHVESGLVEFL